MPGTIQHVSFRDAISSLSLASSRLAQGPGGWITVHRVGRPHLLTHHPRWMDARGASSLQPRAPCCCERGRTNASLSFRFFLSWVQTQRAIAEPHCPTEDAPHCFPQWLPRFTLPPTAHEGSNHATSFPAFAVPCVFGSSHLK